jgi:hypothetical protein
MNKNFTTLATSALLLLLLSVPDGELEMHETSILEKPCHAMAMITGFVGISGQLRLP